LPGAASEDVVLAPDGRVLDDGSILSIDSADGDVRCLANTGGSACRRGWLVLICDSIRGLLRMDPAGGIEVLVDRINGEPLPFASNVVRDDDGAIYFSSSTRHYSFDTWMGDILEHSGTGSLFRRDPSGRIETLVDGLQFANGVVLSPIVPVCSSTRPARTGSPAIG
jgi:sugar lactone lactonase YvrE